MGLRSAGRRFLSSGTTSDRDSTQHNDDHFEGIFGVLDLSLPVGGVLGLAGPRLDPPISKDPNDMTGPSRNPLPVLVSRDSTRELRLTPSGSTRNARL